MALKGVKLKAQEVLSKYEALIKEKTGKGLHLVYRPDNKTGPGTYIDSKFLNDCGFPHGHYAALAESPTTPNTYNPVFEMMSWNDDKRAIDCYGSFYLHQLHGCCGVCVLHNAHTKTQWQNKGIGTILQAMRIDIARNMGYGLALCTDKEVNVYQKKILAKNGWTNIFQYTNPRTSNVVNLSVQEL